MRFACEQCHTKYSIPDERVRGKILKIRCKNCNCLISLSEGGVSTSRAAEGAMGGLGEEAPSEGGDSTMIGGMADFFGKQAPVSESDEWHLSVDGNQNGPMALANLTQRILEQAGTSAELYVWKDGFDVWKPVDSVPEIQAAVEKARGTPPRSAAPAKAALLSLESEGGDATQIGSLDFNRLTAGEEDVQDASMLSIEPDAMIEALSSSPSKPATRPAAPPKAPPPFKASAPPPFKAPPAARAATIPAGPALKPPGPTSPGSGPGGLPPRPPGALLKTLPHRGLRPATPLSEPAPFTPPAEPSPPPAAPPPDLASLIPPSAPSISSVPTSNNLPNSSARTGGPDSLAGGNLASAEPSVMSALQFSGPTMDNPGAAANTGLASSESPAPPQSKLPLIIVVGLVLGLCGGGYFLLSRPGRPLGPKVEKAAAQVDAGADDAGAGGGAKTASASAKAQDKGSPKKPGVEGLSDDDLKDLLSSHESALSKCYDKALKKDSSLSGKVLKVDIEVTAKGKASDVALDGPDSDGKLGKCVGKVIKKWKFPKGPAKKPYKARFPLSIK